MNPEADFAGSPVGVGPSSAVIQILVVIGLLHFANILVTKLGGGSLRAGLWVGIPAFVVAIFIASAFLRSGGSNWQQLGLVAPSSWSKTVLFVLATGVAVSITMAVAQNLSTSLFGAAPPDSSRFAALQGNLPLLVIGLIGMWITSAFGEELLVRGFLLDRLTALFGGGQIAVTLAVVTSSVLFGLGHAYQGTTGVIASIVAGVLYAVFYLLSGRNLWVTILAHGLLDTMGFIAIYASGGRGAAG